MAKQKPVTMDTKIRRALLWLSVHKGWSIGENEKEGRSSVRQLKQALIHAKIIRHNAKIIRHEVPLARLYEEIRERVRLLAIR